MGWMDTLRPMIANNRVQRRAASGLRLQQGRNRRVRCNDWFSDPGTPGTQFPSAWKEPSFHPLPRSETASTLSCYPKYRTRVRLNAG